MGAFDDFPMRARNWLRAGGIMMWRRIYVGRGDQVRPARKFAASHLADTPRAGDAEWIAAELISNALLHSRSGQQGGWFGIEVVRGRLARIAVYDLGGGGVPRISPASQEGELRAGGMGLRSVNELAVRMGIKGNPQHGHLVWAQLSLLPTTRQVIP